MKTYKPYLTKLVEPPELFTHIPHKISQYAYQAIEWIENNSFAYEACFRKKIKFATFDQYISINVNSPNVHVIASYNNPYGKMKEEGDSAIVIEELDSLKEQGFEYQTYCTMGVSTFLWYYMQCEGLTYKQARKKHPIYYLCQKSGNQVVKLLRSNGLKAKKHGYCFKELDFFETLISGLYARDGALVIAAMDGTVGHVSTVIGLNDDKTPMVYNIGAKNGYMSIDEAFGEGNRDRITYHILCKEENEKI